VLQFIKKIEKDIWVILLLIFISTYTIFNLKHWNKENRVIAWDVVSYYGYLPAAFIYDDVTLTNPNKKIEQYQHTFWYHETEEGKKVFKTSMGMAMLYAPFFFASHLYTLATDGIASGFSPPYKFAICISSLFYFLIGLIFLRKLLRRYFSSNVVAITLLLIGLGTNLYYYVVISVGYPHNYLFSLLAVAAYFILKWYDKPTLKTSLVIGLLFGLMVLVRPTMIFVILFALLFNLNSIKLLKERVVFFKTHILQILTIIIFAFIVWIPQFIYWKMASGNYLFYSYTEEGFFFNDPQIFNALFGFRKGWLLYTPIMFFALFGLGWMIKNKEKIALSLILTVVTYFYVATCWWDWWFGGSFGYRTMIDMFPLLAFGLAYFIQKIITYSKGYKISFLTVLFLLLGFNLFQTRQAHEGLLHHDSMTKTAYFKILFKLQSQITKEEVEPFLKIPDYEEAKKGNRNQ
jgi:hypothetical protein